MTRLGARRAPSARCCTKAWPRTPTARSAWPRDGDVRFEPCHHHQAVGPMAGMTTYSMPVLIVENRAAGNRALLRS